MVVNKYWSNERLREVMDNFSADFKNKKYSEKIEYELWRKIRNIKVPVLSCEDTVINIYERYDHKKIASFRICDWGFGRFLYDNHFKEEAQKNNMNGISAINNKISAVDAKAISSITIKGETIDSTATAAAVVNTKLNDSKDLYWSDKIASNTYATTTSEVGFCDICYHKNKCDNCCYAKKTTENENKDDEGEKTKVKGFDFDFGPCTSGQVRMSMYGLAIKNVNGEWVSYNNGQVVNVDVLSFDGAKYMFKMPVAVKDIAVGDIVIHNRVPMFVESVENGIHVVDIRAGEKKEILPTTNMFGFNFVTKIVSMFNAFQSSPTPDQPFGNMLPFLMLNGEDGKSMDSDTMLMFMMMQNQNDSTNMFANPMMLYFLMKDKDGSDLLPLMLMMNQNK